MDTTIIQNNGDTITIELKISMNNSFLNMEENIQRALNEAGNVVTEFALSKYDTDGSPIITNETKLTSKGKVLNPPSNLSILLLC